MTLKNVVVQDKHEEMVIHLIQILITRLGRLEWCTLCFHNSWHFPTHMRSGKKKKNVFRFICILDKMHFYDFQINTFIHELYYAEFIIVLN